MTASETSDTIVWGEIDGETITLPVVVEEMDQITLTFTVPAETANALLPGDAFEVVETAPGTASFVMALVAYVKNPWGDYAEVNLGFLVHPTGDPDAAGSFVYRMPVNQEFTMKCGSQVMGFPKTVEDIVFTRTDETVTVRLDMDGKHVLTVAVPRAAAQGEPTEIETVSYSYLDGVATRTPLVIEMGTGIIDPAAVQMELGDSPVADELASLGLPKTPDLAVWGEGLAGTFHQPETV